MNTWDRLRKSHAEVDRITKESIAETDRVFRTVWQTAIGDRLKEMLESRAATEKCLADKDPGVRRVAIMVLSWHWKARYDERFRSALEEIALRDPDVAVRGIAIAEIAVSYWRTDDVRIGRLLATMVYDQTLAAELRDSAYRGLFSLRSMDSPSLPGRPLRIPDEIDWSFVDSFLVEGRTACPVDHLSLLPEGTRELFELAREARSAYERGEYWDAIGALTEMIEAVPDAPGPYQMRGHAYLETGNLDAAIADLTRSIELEPKSAASYRFRSGGYAEKGMMDLARRDAQRARELAGEQGSDSRSS